VPTPRKTGRSHFNSSFIREDNKSWLDIRRKLGFVEIGTKYVSQWADGTSGNMVILKRDLYALRPQLQKHKTIRYLENTITAFDYPHTVPPKQNKNDVAF
jgi:hypothetical protein